MSNQNVNSTNNKLFNVRKVVREYRDDDELKNNIKHGKILLFLCQHILNGDFFSKHK